MSDTLTATPPTTRQERNRLVHARLLELVAAEPTADVRGCYNRAESEVPISAEEAGPERVHDAAESPLVTLPEPLPVVLQVQPSPPADRDEIETFAALAGPEARWGKIELEMYVGSWPRLHAAVTLAVEQAIEAALAHARRGGRESAAHAEAERLEALHKERLDFATKRREELASATAKHNEAIGGAGVDVLTAAWAGVEIAENRLAAAESWAKTAGEKATLARDVASKELEQRLVEAARTAVAESQRREAEGFDRLAAAVVAAVQPIVVERQLQAALARRRVVQAAFESP